MNSVALLMAIVGLSTVQCLPSEMKGRQEAVAEAVADVAAETVAAAATVAANVAANVDVDVNVNKDAYGHHDGHKPGHHYPTINLNLLSAIGHIVSPLVRGVLEPLCTNIVYGVVGGVIKTLQNPESVVDDHPHEHGHDPSVYPAKFPEYRSAPGSEALNSLLKGFDAYVMQVPGAGKYLFISSDRNLAPAAAAGSEADKNYSDDAGYEEIPFSANPLLNSIFGTIRVRSGPIPDKRVESYVKQQLGAEPESAAASD